jgi:ZIP family zinc transporter
LSTARIVFLGAIAGLTIFLGLPLGRLHSVKRGIKVFLGAVSAGILVFLLFDILSHATEPVEEALSAANGGKGSWGSFAAFATTYTVGLGIGLLSLHYGERLWRRRPRRGSIGPGAMAVAEDVGVAAPALGIGLSIATAIGLHNFSEGLAIGASAHAGEIQLATLLVVGFALHNATEGFGIIGPAVAAGQRPSWRWLGLAGLIGGGPTFLGTLLATTVGAHGFVYVGFLTLAAGAILYVIGELFAVGRRMSWDLTLWGLLAGFLLGLATDFVITAAGA